MDIVFSKIDFVSIVVFILSVKSVNINGIVWFCCGVFKMFNIFGC